MVIAFSEKVPADPQDTIKRVLGVCAAKAQSGNKFALVVAFSF